MVYKLSNQNFCVCLFPFIYIGTIFSGKSYSVADPEGVPWVTPLLKGCLRVCLVCLRNRKYISTTTTHTRDTQKPHRSFTVHVCQLNVTRLISRIKNQTCAFPTAVPEAWRNAISMRALKSFFSCASRLLTLQPLQSEVEPRL